ncbi:DUF3857 domain-containing protein [Bdellovibrio sp. HCB209]|uniref:DUF3857 domain-containing protein n=1 Tax=Bdellovibrio sp. HCB209 TaxID=3394354 RepID=UPI0039B4B5F1
MKNLIFVATLILCSITVHADWMQESEAPFVILNSVDEVTVDKDGNHESTTTTELQVLNEQGRNYMIQQSVPFVPDAETVEFISGSSKTDGIETIVRRKDVKTREMKSPEQGQSHMKEMIIPFNNLKIGSSTKFTTKTKSKKKLVKGLFQQTYSFGVHAPERGGKARIKSLLPLHVAVNDFWKVLTTKESKEGNYYVLEIEQIKPLYKLPKEAFALLDINNLSRVDVSTFNNWNEVAKPLSVKYESVLATKKMPASFTKIINKANAAATNEDKINIVTSELASIMTYRGTWTSFEKMYIASPLNKIAQTKTGDCKDFALATTAMLRALGLKANVALVKRTSADGAPRLGQIIQRASVNPRLFNHAIVKVTEGEKVYWVDPTNIVSNASFVNPDLAGSVALEISPSTTIVDWVEAADASASNLSYTKTIRINQDSTADTTTDFTLTGEYANTAIEQSFAKSEDSAKKVLRHFLRVNSENSTDLYEGVNFRNRITKSISGKQKVVGEELVQWQDKKLYLDTGFPLSLLTLLNLGGEKRVSDAFTPNQFSEKATTHVVGYDFIGFPEECVVLTPWFKIHRSLFKEDGGFRIEDNISYNASILYSWDMNSETFKYMLSEIPDCARDRYVHIQPLQPGELLSTRLKDYTLAKTKEQMDRQGPDSIPGFRNAYHITAHLLEQNPDDKDAAIFRARAVRRIRYMNETVSREEYLKIADGILEGLEKKHPEDPKVLQQKTWNAFYRKDKEKISALFAHAFKASPKDYAIYSLGGNVLETLGQKQAALGSYTKAFELAKEDKEKAEAAEDLGGLLLEFNQIDNGVAYYKYAIKLNPGNPWLAGNFVAHVQRYDRWDDAISVGEEVVRTNPYGMAKYVLASAYAGKANNLIKTKVNNPLDEVKNAESAENLFAKGLAHSPGNEKCLIGLARIYGKRAMTDKNPSTAQKSLRYIEKALKSDKTNPKAIEELRKSMISIAGGSNSERIPAAASATAPQNAVTEK